MLLKQRLRDHLSQIVRERDPYLAQEGHLFVQTYIRQELEQWGIVQTHEFMIQSRMHTNLTLHIPAEAGRQQQPPILVAAHYDAVPGTQGADDNATGVAALLELARSFASDPARYPLQLVAFDLEEYGLLGSDRYAAHLVKQNQQLRLMLSLEMLGYCDQTPGSQKYPPGFKYFYPDRGNFIGLIGNLPTFLDMRHLSRSIKQAGVPAQWLPAGMKGQLLTMTRLSDHAPFWDRGYPAIMVTDTAFLRNPHYHKPSDRLGTLDLDFFTGVCQGLIDGIRCL